MSGESVFDLKSVYATFFGKRSDVEKNWHVPVNMGEWGALMQLSRRRLFLFTEIMDQDLDDEVRGVGWLIKGLYSLDELSNEPITLYINSPGGDISAGLALVNVMRDLTSPVHTFVVGQAASMAAIVAVAGVYRKAYPTARWLLHRGKSVAQGDAEDMDIEAKEFKTLDTYADQVIINAAAGKITPKRLGQLQKKNYYLGSAKAMEIGLLDEIVVPRQWQNVKWIPGKGETSFDNPDEQGTDS